MNFTKEVNSYEDLCKILGIDPELKPDVSTYDQEDQAAAISMFRIWKASKAAWKYVQKTINWNDRRQKKWSIWANLFDEAGSGSGFSFGASVYADGGSSVGARLVFPEYEIAVHIFGLMEQDFKNIMKYPVN